MHPRANVTGLIAVVLLTMMAAHCAVSREWLFDFGTEASMTQPGFTKVTARTSYDAAKGHGFETVEGLTSADRGGWEKTAPTSERRARTYGAYRTTARTTADLIEGTADSTFIVQVGPGDYTVWLIACDAHYEPPFFEVWANGAKQFDVRVPRRYFVFMEPFTVRSEDGLLKIEFRGPHGWLVNALLISDDVATAEQTAARLERDIFFETEEDAANWNEVKPTPENPAPTLTPEQRQRGYVSFVRDYTRQVFPTSVPAQDEIDKPLTAFAVPGEFEPVSLCIFPLRELGTTEVEVGDFVSDRGLIVPSSAVSLGIVRCWPQRVGTTRGATGAYRVVPEMIDPPVGRRRIVRAGEAKQWWLTVHLPADATPGRYRAPVTIHPAKAPALRLEWRLLVLPFPLTRPASRHWGTWLDGFPPLRYLSGPARRGRNTAAERARLSRAEILDFRDHGFDTALLPANGVTVTENADGSFSYDLGTLPEQMEYLKLLDSDCAVTVLFEYLCRHIEYQYADEPKDKHVAGTFSPKARKAIVGLVRFIRDEAKRRGWPTLYYYPIDEPGNSKTENRYAFAENVLDMVHDVPGCRTAMTCTANCVRRLGERRVDVRIYAHGHYTSEKVLKDAAKGFPFWYYSNGIFYAESTLASRGRTGFEFLRSGAETATAWGFAATCGNPYNDFDGGHEDWNVLFPGADGPIPTIYWELCREGVDDARYATTLGESTRRARKDGNSVGADRGAAVLTALTDPAAAPVTDPRAFQRLRWRAAREILGLSADDMGLALDFAPVLVSTEAPLELGPNLIHNPSFEAGPGDDGLPGWPYPFTDPFVDNQEKPLGAISVTDEEALTGRYSLKWDCAKVVGKGGSSFGTNRWLVINVQIPKDQLDGLRGKRVRVGMWVRIGSGLVNPGMNLRQFGGGKYLDGFGHTGGISDPTVWNHYQAEGRLRTDFDGLDIHTYCRIPKDADVAAQSHFYTDDVCLQVIREEPLTVRTALDEYYVGEPVRWSLTALTPVTEVTISLTRDGKTMKSTALDEASDTVSGEFSSAGLAPGLYTVSVTATDAATRAVLAAREIILTPDPFAW